MRTLLAMVVLAAAFTGCTTTCRFDTNAPGTKLYLDGAFKGILPCSVELDDGQASYTLHAEGPGYQPLTCMISQQYAGTVTQQQTTATAQGTTNTYGGTSTTYAQGQQTTQTQQYAAYAWPSRMFVTLAKDAQAPAPVAAPPATEQTPSPASTSGQASFCSKCGRPFASDAQFCAGCGSRR